MHEIPLDKVSRGSFLPPPILGLARPDEHAFCDLSDANLSCLALLQRAGTHEHLARLAREWSDRCFVHGDLRLANIVVEAPETGGEGLWLVDWEMAGAAIRRGTSGA